MVAAVPIILIIGSDPMSALPPKADMCTALGDVRFAPNSGHLIATFCIARR